MDLVMVVGNTHQLHYHHYTEETIVASEVRWWEPKELDVKIISRDTVAILPFFHSFESIPAANSLLRTVRCLHISPSSETQRIVHLI